MPVQPTVFSQVMEFMPRPEFRRCVERHAGERKVRRFSCSDQFLCMAFAQLTGRESLRDIETCLRAMQPRLYHMGIRGHVARSTLADANEKRPWHIYADFAGILMAQARALYCGEDIGVALDSTVYAFDSTTIDLCLSMFPWAHHQQGKAAVKMHTLLNLRGNIPEFIYISDTKLSDVAALDLLVAQPGSYYLLDRGYIDYRRLFALQQASAYFVTRAKSNFQFKRRYSHPVDGAQGIRFDQTILLTGAASQHTYPHPMRRIGYTDTQTGKELVFITNNFTLPAPIIAQLYKARWRVELFFKWIKQHLRIKAFYGTSPNAVKTQIWIALCTYLLVAILKRQLQLTQNLYTILQILSVSVFEKTPILHVFSDGDYTDPQTPDPNQLYFKDL